MKIYNFVKSSNEALHAISVFEMKTFCELCQLSDCVIDNSVFVFDDDAQCAYMYTAVFDDDMNIAFDIFKMNFETRDVVSFENVCVNDKFQPYDVELAFELNTFDKRILEAM